jgi:hypothetical protein
MDLACQFMMMMLAQESFETICNSWNNLDYANSNRFLLSWFGFEKSSESSAGKVCAEFDTCLASRVEQRRCVTP